MRPTTCRPPVVGSVDDGELELEVVRLQSRREFGLARSLKLIGVGLFEMNVLFDSRMRSWTGSRAMNIGTTRQD